MRFLIIGFALSPILLFTAVVPATGTEDSPNLTFLYEVREAGRGIPLLKPCAIHVDTLKGEIFISDRGRKEIFVYDEAGKYIQKVGRRNSRTIPFKLVIDSDRNLVVGNQDQPKLSILDFKGEVVEQIDLEFGRSKEFLPGGMAISPAGAVYVAERYGRSVARVDLQTRRAELWFTHPEESNKTIELQDVVTLPDGTVILVSSRGNAIRILDDQGRPGVAFGEHGSRESQFSFPSAVTCGPKGNLWIVDTFQHSIKVFDRNGRFIREYGELGNEPGKFFFPIDIAFGKGGKVLVLERGTARFQVFQLE